MAFEGLDATAFEFWGSPVLTAADGTYFCPGFQGNTYASNPWDFMLINGVQTPGVVTVQCEKERAVDKKKAAGTDGERLTIHGLQLAVVSIQLLIWTPEQLRIFASLWTTICPRAGKQKPTPFDVSHPQFSIHSVKSLLIIGGHGPDPGSVPRSRAFTIKALEYAPPGTKNVTQTPVEAIGSLLDPGVASYPTPGSNPANTAP